MIGAYSSSLLCLILIVSFNAIFYDNITSFSSQFCLPLDGEVWFLFRKESLVIRWVKYISRSLRMPLVGDSFFAGISLEFCGGLWRVFHADEGNKNEEMNLFYEI